MGDSSASASAPLASALSLRGLSKQYRDGRRVVDALRRLDLDVPPGSLTALLGTSGCGKTTALKLIAGTERASAGTIELGARSLHHLPPYRRPVNTVWQHYALWPHMSVLANVSFGLRRQRVPRRSAEAQSEAMLELVGLPGYGSRRPGQLSGGQQQRVALARALVNQPLVLLLDEPLSALDAGLRRDMQREIRRIQSDIGVTTIHVTHDQDEALSIADRVAIMRDGTLVQAGTPEELWHRPHNAWVARFLGRANLLPGVVAPRTTGGGHSLVKTDRSHRGVFRSAPSATDGLRRDQRVLVGVRPEVMTVRTSTVDRDRDDQLDFLVPSRVRSVTFKGNRYSVSLSVERVDQSVEASWYPTDDAGQARPPEPGEIVTAAWRPTDTFVVADDAG